MKTRSRIDKFRFPNYFLGKEAPFVVKGLALFVALLVLLFIVDTLGVTYKPNINVDAYNVDHTIPADTFGYSIDSNFTYDQNLVDAVKATGAETIRVMDEYEPGARMLLKVENGDTQVLASDDVAYNPNQDYQLKIKVENNNIKIYIDNQLVFDVNDSRFAQGEIGLTSSNNLYTYFDNVQVKSNNSTIFSDNFSGNMSKWDNGDIPSFFNQGNWEITDGKIKHTGKESLTLKRAGSRNWKNYEITANIKSTSANFYDIGHIGMVFRYNGALNNYKFLWRSNTRQPYVSNNPWGVADFEAQLDFAKNANLKPNMVINMRNHSTKDAADLVREMNINRGLDIKYWELGNEIWGWSDSYIDNVAYANKVIAYSKAMKAVDPSIKIGASTLLGFSDWDNELIRIAAPQIDFIIFHYYPYFVQDNVSDNHILAEGYAFGHNYKNTNGQGMGIVENARELIRKEAPGNENRIEVVLTEFNTGDYNQGVDLIYGLATADILGESARQDVKLVQFHKLDNETGWQWGSFTADYRPKPTALAIGLYSEHFGEKILNTNVTNSPSFSVTEKFHVPAIDNIPYLSAYSSRSADNTKLYLMVVNKHPIADMRTSIKLDNAQIKSGAKVFTLNGDSIHSDNTYQDDVSIAETRINYASNNFTYNFPAHSVTAIELDILKLEKPSVPKVEPNKTETTPAKNSENTTTSKATQTNTATPAKQKSSQSDTKIVASAGFGGNPHVRAFNEFGYPTGANFFAYDGNFRGGVSIAYGDIDGDGHDDIVTGAGPGGGPQVRAFTEEGKEIANFFPFHPEFRGGVNVATGDVDGDGIDEIAASQASNGQAWVKVYKNDRNKTVIGTWNTFAQVECGADVAMGDVDGDGLDEIIVGAGKGGGPHVRVYEANGTLKPIQFFAFHELSRNGISVAAADVDGDGKAEIAVSQSGQEQAWVKVYRYDEYQTIIGTWIAYGDQEIGAHVGMGDINNDGRAEVVTGTSLGGEPHVLAFTAQGLRLNTNFYVFDRAFKGGIDVDVKK